MKRQRLSGALCAGLILLASPAIAAEQATTVMPTSGPMSMATFAGKVNDGIRAIMSCSWGSSAPANGPSAAPIVYQCWADTTANPVVFKRYDGASWVTYGSLDTSTHIWTPYRNGAPIVAVATSGDASDLTTGTLPAARLPDPTSSTPGGVQSLAATTSQWLDSISTSGVPHASQPAFSDIAGSWACTQAPALAGDISTSAGSCTTAIGAGKVTNSMLAGSIAATKLIGADIATVGTITTGVWAGTTLAVGHGGTNATTPSGARASLGVAIGINVQAWDADLDAFALKTAPAGDVVGTSDAQTLANKTLTSPAIATPTGIVKGDVGLGNVDNTSDATKWAATATLTNKTFDTAGAGNSLKINGTAVTDTTGTGKVVLDNSPALTGTPTAPTASPSDNSTKIATTAYVDAQVAGGVAGVASFKGRTGTVVPAQGDYPTSLIPGTTTNDNATAGNIGEYVSSTRVSGSALSLTNSTQTNVTNLSLTAGDWDVWGTVGFTTAGSTVVSASIGNISTTSATLGTAADGGYFNVPGDLHNTIFPTGPKRISLASTTTVYLVAYSVFTTSTQSVYGSIFARRVR